MARLRVLDTAVRANTKNFERGMKRAGKSLRRFGGIIATVMGTQALRSQAAALDRVAKASDKLGIASENLMGLHHAAEITGISVKTFDMGIQRMTRRVAEAASGMGEARGALKELGLDARELNKVAPDEIFRRVADAMRDVEMQSDRVRLSMKLFDSEGVALVNTLAVGRSGLDAFQKEAERLGMVYSREELAKIERMNDNFNRMGKIFKSLAGEILAFVAPLVEVVGHMTGLAKASAEVELGILGLQHTVLSYLKKFDVQALPGMSLLGIGSQLAEIEKRIHELHNLPTPKVPGVGDIGATGGIDTVAAKVSNLEQTGRAALQTISGGFDVMTIKAQGFGAVLDQILGSLVSMASQTFAQHLMSEVTGGFVPSPLSVDQQRAAK